MKSFDDWKMPLSGIFLALLMLISAPGIAQFVQVGTPSGTSNTTSTYPSPFGNWYWGARQQYLYPASELGAAGLAAGPISAIEFNVSATNGVTHNNYYIAIGQTATTSLTAWESGLTNVYGPVAQTPVVGANTFTFSSPFVWDGVSNIVIEICFENTSFTQNSIVEWSTTLPYNGSRTYRADGTFATNGGCNTTLVSTGQNETRRPITSFQGTLASCGPLTDLAASNVTATSADIAFSNISGDVYIEYGPVGFTPGTQAVAGGGTVVGPFTTSPQGISGLSASSAYDVYVRQDCGSEWSVNSSITINTVCAAYSTPYFESFESLPATTNATWPETSCIEAVPTGTTTLYRWNREVDQPPSGIGTGPSAPQDGGIYAFTESSQGGTGAITTLDLGPIDLSALTDPALSFYYHMHGAAMGTLNVYASSDGIVWDPLTSFTGAQQASNTSPWLEQILSLSAYSGQTISLRFEGVRGTSFTSDIAIDAISVDEAPACFAPTDLAANVASSTSADVSWTCAGCTGDFYVEYGAPGFIPGTGATAGGGTVVGPIVGTSTTISTLTADTDYQFVVRQDCGVDGFSDNSSAVSIFTGACSDGGPSSTADSNLELVFLDGIGATQISQAGCPGIVGVVDYTAQSADVSEILSFDLQIDYGTCGGNFGGAGSVWVDWNENLTFEPGELIGSDSFTPPFSNTYSFTVPGGTALGPKKMRVIQQEGGSLPLDPCASFTWGSVWDFTLNVVAPPNCTQPVASFNLLPDCDISEFSIEVEVTDAGSSTGGLVDITNNGGQPALTGVGPGTYVIGPFTAGPDVVVTVVNLDDNICNLNGPALGTDCVLCTSGGPSSTADSNVELVEIDGFAGSGFSHVGCPGVLGVQDLTSLSVDIPNGFSYDLTVDLGTCGGNFGAAGTVWIDWNGDFEFSAAEVIGTSTVNPSSNVFAVTPPPGTPVGSKIMRVMQEEGGSLPLDPCGSFTWGSVMDFTVNVIADPGCVPPDADLTLDASSCAGTSFEYFISVDILSTGDSPGGEVTISNSFDGNTIPNATVAGSPYVYGPFPSGTVLDVNLEHLGNALCTFSTGFTHDCPPLNDLCVDAEVIPVNAAGACMGAATSASTNAASTDGPTATCLIGGLTDVWFEFTTGTSPYINWEITLGTMEAIGVEIWDGCPGVGSSVYCLADQTSDPNTFVELQANSTYLFRVLTLPQFSGTFDICIEEGPDSPSENCLPEYSSTTPTLDVLGPIPGGEIITDLDVVLNMSNPNVGNLLVELVSPCGTTITLQEEQCDGLVNMDVQYDDASTDTFTEFCPLGIGSVQPQQALASFNNQPIVGTWTLNVTNATTGVVQAIDSWCLIPTLFDGCPPPQIVVTSFTDNSITVDSDPASCYDPINYASYDLTWTGGGSATGVTFPYEITGLTPGTFYVIDAVANCTVGGSSNPGGVSQTTLNCTPAELCTYELTLENTDGTGWDGAFATVDNGWTVTDYVMDPDVSIQTWTVLACPGNAITLSVSNGGNGALPGTKTISFVNSDNVEVYFEAGPPESTLYSQADGCPDCASVTNIEFTRVAADLVEVSWQNIALPANVTDIDVIVGTEDLFGFTEIASVLGLPAGTTSASVPLGASYAFQDVTVQVITNCTNEGSGLAQEVVSLPACLAADQCEYLFDLTSTGDGWGPFSLDVLLGGTVSYSVALGSGTSGQQSVYACPDESIDITALGESVAYSGPPYCNQSQGGPGFPELQACEDVVCADDAFCCDNTWDSICASSAEGFAECAPCLDTAPAGLACSSVTYEVVLNPGIDDVTLVPASDFCDVADGETFFSGTTCPSCFASTLLAASNVDYQSADISWNSDNPAGTNATVYLGLPGFTPGLDELQSQVYVTTGVNPEGAVNFTGLSEETTYEVIIIEDCGGGDLADASAPLQFTTGALGESCDSPIPIDCTTGIISGNTSGVPNDTGTSGAITCTTTLGSGGQIWYAFTPANNNNTTLSLCGSGYDTKIHVYQGSCGAFTCVTGNDDFCGLQSEVSFAAVGGETYYVRVGGFGSSEGAFDLTITCGPTIDCFSPTVDANVVCSATGFDVLVDIGADGTATDYTVSYTQNAGAPVVVGTTFAPGTTGINLGTEFAFGDIIDVSVVDNDFPATCFVDVVGVTTLAGDCPPPNDNCSTAIPLVVGNPGDCPTNTETFDTSTGSASAQSQDPSCDGTTGNFDVYYTFVAPATGGVIINLTNITSGLTERMVRVSCTGAEVPGSCGSGNGSVTGLTPGVEYVLQIWHDSFNVGQASVCLEASPPPPANDLCGNAINVACNSTTTGSTAQASATGAPATCGTGLNTAPGVWYTVDGIDGTMVASLCGSSYDTKIGVFEGACGALTCVIGVDDFCGLQSEVSWIATSGTTYYIYVTGFGTATGSFTMDVNCFPYPANNDCVDAQTLVPAVYPNVNNALGTLNYATAGGAAACAGAAGPDAYYTFNVPLENHYWVNLNPFGGFTGTVEVLDACNGTVVACGAPPAGPFCDEPQGGPGFPSDPTCEASVCAGDSFCCTNTWDGLCASDAATDPACSGCVSSGNSEISLFIQNLPAGDYIVRVINFDGTALSTTGNFLVNVQSFPFAGVQDNPNNFLYACNQGGFQLEDFVGATPQSGQGALDYEWYIYEEGGTYSNEWQRGEPNYASRCTWLGMDYGTTYNVYVRILLDVPNVGPVWGVYPYLNPADPFAVGAAECTISTSPNVTPTEVRPNYTPTNVQGNNYALCDFVVAYNVSEAQQFRWRFDGNNNFGDAEDIEYLGSNSPSVRLSWVDGLLPGATYNVGVEVRVDGVWSGYSTILPINLALPSNTVQLRSQFCPATLSPTAYVLSQSVCAADSYTFEFAPQGGGTPSTFTSGNYVCFFNNLTPALSPGVYDVRVKVTQNGIASDFGPVCEVTISGPGTPDTGGAEAMRSIADANNATLFPNPSAGGEVRLTLDGLNDGNHEVNVAVYDVYGKLISSDGFGHEGNELSRLIRFDRNLAMGMYMVHIFVDGEQFAVERLVVK